jgi:glycosyltransferase involved in cell wall biosynthesis
MMMRISCVSVSDQLGGSEVALAGMVTALARLRPEWRFQVVLPGDGPLRERLRESGAICSVVTMPEAVSRLGEWAAVQDGWRARSQVALGIKLCGTAAVLPEYEARLGRAISEFRPNVVHTNGLKAHVLGARLRIPDTRLVWHIHEYLSRRRLTGWLLRRYRSRCAAVVANSASVADDAARSIRPVCPVHLVPNPVDLDVFSPDGTSIDLDRLAGLPDPPAKVTRIGLVATYGRWKGHEVFLDALGQLASRAAIRGYIIGGPIYDTANSQLTHRELESMIHSRRLQECVGLTGFVDPAPAMRALDIVVHASTEPEPFGLVIAEALACGKAVITTGYGGAAELICDGQNALVAAPGQSQALAEAIAKLANDPALRAAIGQRARDTACVKFAPQTIAAQAAHVFETLAIPSRMARPA